MNLTLRQEPYDSFRNVAILYHPAFFVKFIFNQFTLLTFKGKTN